MLFGEKEKTFWMANYFSRKIENSGWEYWLIVMLNVDKVPLTYPTGLGPINNWLGLLSEPNPTPVVH